jgi:cytidine deaminase
VTARTRSREPARPRSTRAQRDALVDAARRARTHAIAPFSRFAVGAALETEDGAVITGCNIENATYGLTLCAERVALFKALSEGHLGFRRVAVVADTDAPTPPCGACRQLLWEYGGDIEVVLANLATESGRYRMRDLLPVPFDARVLQDAAAARGAAPAAAPPAPARERRARPRGTT